MLSLESSMNQEQSLHSVTRAQLTALQDDNDRLRTQLQDSRKRSLMESQDRYALSTVKSLI